MKFEDRIYGSIQIDDPTIQAIVASQPFQRLRGVNQYGGVNLIYTDRFQISRFEHSIGVWWVLRSLGVDLETQVAGLLHDVGHTAFSHMVDLAIGGEAEDFHEKHLHLIPGWAELLDFLKSKDISMKTLEHYPEVKTPMPRVGADRLDYAMRDFIGATNIATDLGTRVLNHIHLRDRVIHFTDVDLAREFALTGLEGLYEVIYAPPVAVVYEALTELLRNGLSAGWLTPEILYGNDQSVLQVIKEHQGESPHLRLFNEPFSIHSTESPGDTLYRVKKGKIRYFDPPVLIHNESRLLSEVDSEYKRQLTFRISSFEARRHGEAFSVKFTPSASTSST